MDSAKVFSCALATIAMCVSVFALYRAHQFDAFAWRLVRQNSGTSEIVVEYLGEVQKLRDRVEQLERTKKWEHARSTAANKGGGNHERDE